MNKTFSNAEYNNIENLITILCVSFLFLDTRSVLNNFILSYKIAYLRAILFLQEKKIISSLKRR